MRATRKSELRTVPAASDELKVISMKGYASYALIAPQKCKIVAIAEPRIKTRRDMANTYSLNEDVVYTTWQELHSASSKAMETSGSRIADAIVIAVQDSMHKEVVLAFAEQGYHILCEKPMATSLEDCVKIAAAVKTANIIFGMGHGSSLMTDNSVADTHMHIYHSTPLFALQQVYRGNYCIWQTRTTYQCAAYRASRLLSLCSFICAGQLEQGRTKLILVNDEKLSVRSAV